MPPYLPNADLPGRYGVVRETITKWKKDPKMGFPKPAAIINGREFYDVPVLDEWDRQTLDNDSSS